MCCQASEVTPAVLTTPASQSASLDVSDKPGRSSHGATPSRQLRWHVKKCERRAFWKRDGEIGCIWHALIQRITGHLVEDAPRINNSFMKSSGAQSKVLLVFVVWFVTAIDVKHVCAGHAAEAGDLVKAGIRLLHPDLIFTPSVSVWLRVWRQVHSGCKILVSRAENTTERLLGKAALWGNKTHISAPTLSSCTLRNQTDSTDKSWLVCFEMKLRSCRLHLRSTADLYDNKVNPCSSLISQNSFILSSQHCTSLPETNDAQLNWDWTRMCGGMGLGAG